MPLAPVVIVIVMSSVVFFFPFGFFLLLFGFGFFLLFLGFGFCVILFVGFDCFWRSDVHSAVEYGCVVAVWRGSLSLPSSSGSTIEENDSPQPSAVGS